MSIVALSPFGLVHYGSLPSIRAYGECALCAHASSCVGEETSAPVPEDTWASGPSFQSYAFATLSCSVCVFLDPLRVKLLSKPFGDLTQ